VNKALRRRHQPMELTPQTLLLFRPSASMLHDDPAFFDV
jgi:hypothetical protein